MLVFFSGSDRLHHLPPEPGGAAAGGAGAAAAGGEGAEDHEGVRAHRLGRGTTEHVHGCFFFHRNYEQIARAHQSAVSQMLLLSPVTALFILPHAPSLHPPPCPLSSSSPMPPPFILPHAPSLQPTHDAPQVPDHVKFLVVGACPQATLSPPPPPPPTLMLPSSCSSKASPTSCSRPSILPSA